MSDPVSNTEIEDVLSSIRRLVAGDREEAPTESEETSTPEETSVPEEQDALVLTPSLRVEDAPAPEAGSLDQEARDWDEDAQVDLGEPVPESEETEASFLSEMPVDEGDTGADSAEGADAVEPHAEPAAPEDDVSFEEAEVDMELPSFVRPQRFEAEEDLPEAESSQDIEGVEIEEPVDTPEMDESELEFSSETTLDSAESQPPRNAPRAGFMFGSIREDNLDADDGFAGLESSPELATETVEGSLTEEVSASAEPLEDDEALENAVAADLADETPVAGNSPQIGDGVAEAAALEDAVEAQISEMLPEVNDLLSEAIEAAASEAEDSTALAETPEEPQNLFVASDAMPDEAALRELIAELLHQELQGPLGERITRNVRKLVRREIHRALAARDFD